MIKKLSVKTSSWVNVMLWGAVAVMVCANVFGGAGIPWFIVFAPVLISLASLLAVFAGLGLLAFIVYTLKSKADKK